MQGVMRYVAQKEKTLDRDGTRYLTGVNCVAETAFQSFMATKHLYGKAGLHLIGKQTEPPGGHYRYGMENSHELFSKITRDCFLFFIQI